MGYFRRLDELRQLYDGPIPDALRRDAIYGSRRKYEIIKAQSMFRHLSRETIRTVGKVHNRRHGPARPIHGSKGKHYLNIRLADLDVYVDLLRAWQERLWILEQRPLNRHYS